MSSSIVDPSQPTGRRPITKSNKQVIFYVNSTYTTSHRIERKTQEPRTRHASIRKTTTTSCTCYGRYKMGDYQYRKPTTIFLKIGGTPTAVGGGEEKEERGSKDAGGEEPQCTAAGPRYQTARHQAGGSSTALGRGPGNRTHPLAFPGDSHPGRRGVRRLPCDALARAPGGTFSKWAKACTPRQFV